MLTSRLMGPLLGCMVINLNLTTCRSPAESDPVPPSQAAAPAETKLEGVDTSQLTAREKAQWSAHVNQLLAPCESTPVPVAQCVKEKRDCAACTPAAQYLLEQVQSGHTKAQAEAAYRARFAADQVKSIDLLGSPSRGPGDAIITVVEFADFECPACKAASPALDKVLAENPDVRFVFKNFPLDMHPNAESAARAAMAADKQGKFWEMHHELFAA
ncbi:MAG TPA: thioredoxin domain-containing protein, partial [Polyangiaceae bacterium]|nr:thioredoxin domain-containing protein [Polyangiaceae bacterium]